jgi:hypothetical protein
VGTTEFLANVGLFKHVKEEALTRLAAQLRLVYLPEGHMIRNTSRDTTSVDGLHCEVWGCQGNQTFPKLGG